MLLKKDRKRRAVQLFRVVFAVAVALTVIIACTANGDLGAEISEDSSIERDGFYIQFDGTVTVHNTLNSGLEHADISIYVNDAKNDKKVKIWAGEDIDIPPRSVKEIEVSFRISSTSVFAAILDSIKTEGSPLECYLEISGKCIYGMVDADVSTYIGIPLAKADKMLEYAVAEDTANAYAVELRNLVDWLVPDDDIMHMQSGDYMLDVSLHSNNDVLTVSAESPQDISDALKEMAKKVDSVSLDSGRTVDTEVAREIASAIQYARWIL